MLIFKKYDNEIRYENPMLPLRREQLETLRSGDVRVTTLRDIFNTIPRNFRAIFMYEREFNKAQTTCGPDFVSRLKKCLTYCIEVIG